MTKAAPITRRTALLAAAALPLASATALSPRSAEARAGKLGSASAGFHRFQLGDFEVTTLLAGSRRNDKPRETFGLNVTDAEFAAVSQAAFLPSDRAMNFFTPTLVNTGAELVLFDTGLDPVAMTDVLGAAGVSPDQIDTVVLTHMHGDHIGGLMGKAASGEAEPTFPKARYVTGAIEHNHWSAAANEGFDTKVRPLNDKMTLLDAGGSVTSGITAIKAFGHSPGHMAYLLESGGARLAITADTANHYVWSLAHPDWEVRFDADKAMAAATRKALFGMIAAEKIPFIGYHMPFPGVGFVEPAGSGFRYVPASYQLML